MRWQLACAVACCLIVPNRAAADVDSYYVSSLEWLVDASQSVWLATVHRDKGAVPSVGTTRIKTVDRVLKGDGARNEPGVAELSDTVRAAGEHRVLLFLRPGPKKLAPEVLYVIYLNKQPLPKAPSERAAACRAAIPEGYDRPQPTDSSRCVAIDRSGRVLDDPEEVVRRVENRVLKHPQRFSDAGFYAPRGEELEDQNSDYNVRAPYDADERAGFLKQLRSASGLDRAGAAGHLAHYPDAEVISALKKCLTDDYYNDQTVDDGPGGSPRNANIYIVRRAAYESLKKLNVDVPKPQLERR